MYNLQAEGETMSKKREDLEVILDLLHEYAVEWEEPHVDLFIVGGTGHAWVNMDDSEVNLSKVYGKK